MDGMNQQRPGSRPGRLVLYAVALAAAFLLGAQAGGGIGIASSPALSRQFAKLGEVLRLVRESYVDEPDVYAMIEGAVEGMLRPLDPHSVYIPAKDQQEVEERFGGEFGGVGIIYEIRDEVLTVVSPIRGTPADRMGLRAGDRIVAIDGVSAIGITNDQVHRRLRGPEGSQVTIRVERPGVEQTFELTLTRGKIPIHSVESAFLLEDGITGYIMISQFTAVTETELDQALRRLRREGMEQLILDLRGNSGGYRSQAEAVADRFIEGGRVLFSTRGRIPSANEVRRATDEVTFPYLPLVVLVNRGSASASEIVAGAIQDLDRGLIVGEPTFGKGLVQTPFELGDGSVVRITTSRWYTPSGRCVQRPWDKGIGEYYTEALGDHDTTETDTTSPYYTRVGRKVYGGRGIIPDKRVDPGRLSDYGAALLRERAIFDWAQLAADSIGKPNEPFDSFLRDWHFSREEVEKFLRYAGRHGVDFDREGWIADRDYLLNQLKAEVAQRLYNGREYLWQVLIEGDEVVRVARGLVQEADSLARLPARESVVDSPRAGP